MNIKGLIEKKINKEILNAEEIEFFIDSYTKDLIPDYQASSLITAIMINGLSIDEIKFFTNSMKNSGTVLDFSDIDLEIVDKHSTGGVGDKITLVLMPILASLGYKVAKMSGKGLGYTGGTADKLESIKGYNIYQDLDSIKHNIKTIGTSLTAQTEELVPADKKIYALRDSIACTNSLGLIASSIMSKKLASGANNIVLDITCGSGAFMKTKIDAEKLATIMEELGTKEIRINSIITSMEEPLGYSVGNLLEVRESIKILKGEEITDVLEVVYALASKIMSNNYTREEVKVKIKEEISSGRAYNKFLELLEAHGVNIKDIKQGKFDEAKYIVPYTIEEQEYKTDLWVKEINALEIAKAAFSLGSGRLRKDEKIDPLVGIVLNLKVGDKVNDKLLATIHGNNLDKIEEAKKYLSKAFVFSNTKQEKINSIIKY